MVKEANWSVDVINEDFVRAVGNPKIDDKDHADYDPKRDTESPDYDFGATEGDNPQKDNPDYVAPVGTQFIPNPVTLEDAVKKLALEAVIARFAEAGVRNAEKQIEAQKETAKRQVKEGVARAITVG
jgi:hypothetical protein